MWKKFLSGPLGRFVRAAVAIAVSGFVAKIQSDPRYIGLAPVIQAAGKAARDQFPDELGWLPL